ncbi:transcription factor AP-1 [Sceloporus undulatus]|uniref:transcription factor AP-1 n=1 Tax=Sceloporus undulatus TaxID=8520 RepID=UPI001C4D10A0|nr:transcription factor AP-1 [Sceloporus undulatus]
MTAKMEPTFYEDAIVHPAFAQPESGAYGGYNGGSGASSLHSIGGSGGGGSNAKVLKQSMTLNLADPSSSLKPHLRHSNKGADLLTSPDVGLLKLASPELERLIIQSGNGLITTTPTPTQFLCPKNVTDEQEGFAEGFVRALAELHNQNTAMPPSAAAIATTAAQQQPQQQQPPNPAMAPASSMAANGGFGPGLHSEPPVYANLSNFNPSSLNAAPNNYPNGSSSSSNYPVPVVPAPPPPHHLQHPRLQALKEEPQTVPEMPGETPPLSPIDMESQERIKAERKRMRNRIAASKCRKRKLERIARLEEKVKTLKAQNSELASTANMLREQVAQLKQKVMNHVNSGCQLMLTQQLQTF